MANTPSAKKEIRKINRRTAINKSRRTRMRSYLRNIEEAISNGDENSASQCFRLVQSSLKRSASKGIIHKNTASRKISRLSARVKTLNSKRENRVL
ncbi:30S ribosomal protein S20 [Candidatus Endowatersipora endosymbiont of Watersipora subatra]|uniref:30S ribosomal protein S20 n=1 Tax=Candidatus Endowatersipora endosymbiont of Watersipora subatra TaxID=3077946 RepID=UPI00312CA68E